MLHLATDQAGDLLRLFTKPFDRSKGHYSFFFPMFQALNMLRLLNLEPGSRILEVGAGSGWLTELLVGLGYAVEALEPSAEIDSGISRTGSQISRQAQILRMYSSASLFNSWRNLMFRYFLLWMPSYSSEFLHHVSDENLCLQKSFYSLRPGGWVGIIGESNWQPGNVAQETFLNEEIARYGTLESPFTFEYLEFALHRAGFQDVIRYHGVNGFFPIAAENAPLKEVADLSANFSNNVTARRPIQP